MRPLSTLQIGNFDEGVFLRIEVFGVAGAQLDAVEVVNENDGIEQPL